MVWVYVKVQLRLLPLPSAVDRRVPSPTGSLATGDGCQDPAGLVPAESRAGGSAGWATWPPEPSGRWW
jgi:hypothetical protein